jgi:hypothetical protein
MNGSAAKAPISYNKQSEPAPIPAPAPQPASLPKSAVDHAVLQAGVGNAAVAAAATSGSPTTPAGLLQMQSTLGNAAVTGSINQPPTDAAPASVHGKGPIPLIIEDTIEAPGPGQMKKSAFLAELRSGICQTAAEALAGTPWSEKGCPYIAHWFAYYQTQPAETVERAVRKFAPDTSTAATAKDYISILKTRVRRPIEVWAKTGQIIGIPKGLKVPFTTMSSSGLNLAAPMEGPKTVPRANPLLAKTQAGEVVQANDPHVIQAQLGSGRPLESQVLSKMGTAFGTNFSNVRMHTDATAGRLSSALNARAFTVGEHIAFKEGEYQPGTLVGDALLAHELAHVMQQRGSDASPLKEENGAIAYGCLEEEADNAAVGAVVSLWPGLKTGFTKIARNALPRLKSGLRLARCSFTEAPTNLTNAEKKAEWIKQTMNSSASDKGQAIADLLAGSWKFKQGGGVERFEAVSLSEFIDIQSKVDMAAVLEEMSDWDVVRVGTLGPIRSGRERLNRARADYLYKMTRDRGAAESEVVAHWMFNNMYGDDIKAVLTLLAGDQHLEDTIDKMPAVLELLRQRGIDRKEFKDRSWKWGDIPRGIGHAIGSFLGSSEAAKGNLASAYSFSDLQLPEAYREAMSKVQQAEFEQALSPGNVILGTLDYLAFNIPSTVKGVITGTVSGISEISHGRVEAGTEQLTGPVIFVVTLALGVRAFRRSARMAALLEMTSEGQGALAQLRASIGQKGIDRVAKFAQANPEAAFLIREQGLAGIEALDKAAGNVANARTIIGTNVARLGSLLTLDTLGGLGLETQQALATLSDKTLSSLAGADASTLNGLAQMLRETSPAMRARLTALAESNPTAFGDLIRTQKGAVLDTLRTGPFTTVEELGKAVGKSGERMRIPVVKDGVTVYESIDPAKPPAGWQFKDTVTKRGGSVTIRTDVTDPSGNKGFFVRRFNPATGELEMLEAYLRSKESEPEISSSVPGGVELRAGKGTPTVTYATLRQLRLQGMQMGGLRKVIMRNIENFRSICRLEWMRRNFPSRTLDQLVLDTDSVSYASTSAEQSGSRIVGGKLTGGRTQPIGKLMEKYEAEAAQGSKEAAQRVSAEHDAILKQYGLDRQTPMLTNFDIELNLEPIPPKAPGGSSP